MEEELYLFDKTIKTIPNFDPNNPCNTSKGDQPKSIRPNIAYEIVRKAMDVEKAKAKGSKLAEVFDSAIRNAGLNPDEIWQI